MRALLQLLLLLVVVAVVATNVRAEGPISNQQELIFPIVSIGPIGAGLHFQTSFHFQNLSNSTVQGELAFLSGNGEDATAWLACTGDVLIPPPQSSASLSPSPLSKKLTPIPEPTRLVVTIPPGGSVRRTGVGALSPVGSIQGWAAFNWEGDPRLEAAVEVALIDGEPPNCTPLREIPAGDLVASVTLPATRPSHQFEVPFVISGRRETAISVSNAGDAETTVELTFVDSEGIVRDSNSVALQSHHRKSLLAFEWATEGKVFGAITPPVRPADLHGTVIIKSEQPIVVGAIEIILDELRFLSVPIRMPLLPPFPL